MTSLATSAREAVDMKFKVLLVGDSGEWFARQQATP
jgi:hypothetical protein